MENYGNGTIGGILSVDISDRDVPGIVFGKTARQCTADEIQTEVWAQLKAHLNVGGRTVISDSNLIRCFLDPDIEFPNSSAVTNQEPLLVNTINSLRYRPDAVTELPNLCVASDYVKTYTDVACMEAANEAARRAVNGILLRSVPQPTCRYGLCESRSSSSRLSSTIGCGSIWVYLTPCWRSDESLAESR